MKILTNFSAFLLLWAFIIGIYGWNFENILELTWQMGNFLTLRVMAVESNNIYLWFKKSIF